MILLVLISWRVLLQCCTLLSYCMQVKAGRMRSTKQLNFSSWFLRDKQVSTSCSTYNAQINLTTDLAANPSPAASEGSSSSSSPFPSQLRTFQVLPGQLLLLVFWVQLERLKHNFFSTEVSGAQSPSPQVHCYLFKLCFTGQPPSRNGETQAGRRYIASFSTVTGERVFFH